MKKSVNYKKMPYFQTQVVKVEKVEKDYFCKVDKGDWCGKCPRRPIYRKGNWVNGENLDKIKFPCLCSYSDMRGEHYGMIITNYIEEEDFYDLIDINKQDSHIKCAFSYKSLKELIEEHDIHILNGKVIIFEEEE